MFDRASLKLGLDKAVLQSMSGRDNSIGGGGVSHQMLPCTRVFFCCCFFFSSLHYIVVLYMEICMVVLTDIFCTGVILLSGFIHSLSLSIFYSSSSSSSLRRRLRTFCGVELMVPSWTRKMRGLNFVKRTLTKSCNAEPRPSLLNLRVGAPPLPRSASIFHLLFLVCLKVLIIMFSYSFSYKSNFQITFLLRLLIY